MGRVFRIGASCGGLGVFAEVPFRVGEEVVRFVGALVRGDALPEPYDAGPDRYVQVGEDLFMGPSGEVDDLINHSCAPNCGVVGEGPDVRLVAIEPIRPGDEVTWDYSTTMLGDGWTMECRCGSPACRGVVAEYRTIPEAVRRRYEALGVVPGYVRTS